MNDEQQSPIRTYRLSAGLSLRKLAEKWGTSFATLSRIESGTQPISENLLPVISQATGIPAKELRPDLVEKHEAIFGEVPQ